MPIARGANNDLIRLRGKDALLCRRNDSQADFIGE
jgi:hypothetical protein